jgi:hypothetical protein
MPITPTPMVCAMKLSFSQEEKFISERAVQPPQPDYSEAVSL